MIIVADGFAILGILTETSPSNQPSFIEFSLQLLELEQLWIGTSARSAILANPKRATATPIAIAPKTISVDMTTAEIFGIWRS